jgi:hypothetical protein
MWRYNFIEFIRFFQKGLKPIKIWGSFKFEFVPEFLTYNPEVIWSWNKKESCSLCLKISLCKVWWILDIGKVTILDFKIWKIENLENSERGEGPPVGLTHRLNTRVVAPSLHSPCVATLPHWPQVACTAEADLIFTPLGLEKFLPTLFSTTARCRFPPLFSASASPPPSAPRHSTLLSPSPFFLAQEHQKELRAATSPLLYPPRHPSSVRASLPAAFSNPLR